jgi:uncharacterized protein (TIGR02145 family)
MRHLLLFSFLAACTGENLITKQQNIPPTIGIQSHSDGAVILEGYIESFRAQVSDDDNSFDELEVAWFVDEEEICPWETASSSGESFCDIVFAPEDTSVVAEVRDVQGSGGRAEVSITVTATEAPIVVILSPTQGGSYYADQLIEFSALISDLEDDVSDLIISWSSSVDGELSISTEADSSGEITDYSFLSEGQHAIELRVEDATEKVTTESVVIEVGGDNNEPLCEIAEPISGSAYVVGQNISFAGTATDDDINNSFLRISWQSDQDEEINTTVANTSGELGFVFNGLSSGNHTILLQVEDEVGGLCTDTTLIAVGTPPTLTLTSPISGDVVSVGDAVSFAATVSDQEDIPSGITLSWISNIDGEFSTDGANSNGNISFNHSTFTAGLHDITVTATDSAGLTDSTSLSLRINTPPPAPTLILSPDPVTSNDTLTTTASSVGDADGDGITYAYAWYENSVLSALIGSTVPSSNLDVGEIWTVRVTPNDGYIDGSFTEESITVSNSDPVISSVSVSPNTSVYNDTVLTCTATATDADEAVTPTVEWTVGASTYTGTSLDLSNTSAMPTDIITCTSTVTDSNGGTDADSTAVTVTNRAPSVTAVSISPNTGILTNSTLTCSATVTDDDGESLTPIYEWTVNSASLGASDTLTLTNGTIQPGDVLTCTVTVNDNYGDSASDSTDVTVDNSNPTVDSVTINPSIPAKTDTITCAATASDIDGGSPSLSFVFSNLTTNTIYTATTTGTTDATLDLSGTVALPGDIIECVVTATDTNNGTGNNSATATVFNTAPTFTAAASITPNTGVYTGTTLTCSATASDIDDGNIIPTYEWSVGNTNIGSGATYTVSASDTNVGDSIECTATATDSDSEVTTSIASVALENTVPIVSGTLISPSSTVYNDSTITCSASVTDPDETLSLSYTWSINSVNVGTGTSLDLGTTAALPVDSVVCTASIIDSDGGSDSETDSVTVDNRAPSAPVVAISPTAPSPGDNLVCNISIASVDPDGESVNYTYEWVQNGVTTSDTSDTVSGSDVGSSETWICMVTPDDGTDYGFAGTDSVTTDSALSCLSSTVTDIDGNSYPTVDIGSQCWMGTNLKTTRDASGASINRWCCDCNQYGGMYEWSVVMNGSSTDATQGICPAGWHVPSDSDWFALESYIDTSMTNPNYIGWSNNTIADQLYIGGSSGFDWITGGFSYGGNSCDYNYDRVGYWTSTDYSSTDAVSRFFNTAISGINRDLRLKSYGFYIRCIQD